MVIPIHSLTLETSTICNASCRICPNGCGHRRRSWFMSMKTIEEILEYLRPREINLCGMYESLTDTRFSAILSLINQVSPDAKIVVYTNASLLDKWSEDIFRSVDEIVFSVHGYTKTVYETVMKGLDHDTTYSNIIGFINHKIANKLKLPRIRISFVRNKLNIVELQDWGRFWGRWNQFIDVSDFELMSWQGQVPVRELYPSAPPAYPRRCPMFEPKPNTLVVDAFAQVMLCCYCFKESMSFGHVLEGGYEAWLKKKPVSDSYPSDECKQCNGWLRY